MHLMQSLVLYQKNALIVKIGEWRTEREEWRKLQLEERHEKMQEHREEVRQWMEDNNIERGLLDGRRAGFINGFVRGFNW